MRLGIPNKQIKQEASYICTICHQRLYQQSIKLFEHEKYPIVTAEMYHLMKSFDEKLYICEIYQKRLYKHETPC